MRKVKKQKTRRGGAGMIQYTVSGMDRNTRYPLQFNSSSRNMGMIKGLFITEVNGHKYPEPADEDFDMLQENENVVIHLIRQGNDEVVYQGKINTRENLPTWDDDEMRTFIESLNDGDRLHIELITPTQA
jgi:hypothetical protein